jgi:hypothetical protein
VVLAATADDAVVAVVDEKKDVAVEDDAVATICFD